MERELALDIDTRFNPEQTHLDLVPFEPAPSSLIERYKRENNRIQAAIEDGYILNQANEYVIEAEERRKAELNRIAGGVFTRIRTRASNAENTINVQEGLWQADDTIEIGEEVFAVSTWYRSENTIENAHLATVSVKGIWPSLLELDAEGGRVVMLNGVYRTRDLTSKDLQFYTQALGIDPRGFEGLPSRNGNHSSVNSAGEASELPTNK